MEKVNELCMRRAGFQPSIPLLSWYNNSMNKSEARNIISHSFWWIRQWIACSPLWYWIVLYYLPFARIIDKVSNCPSHQEVVENPVAMLWTPPCNLLLEWAVWNYWSFCFYRHRLLFCCNIYFTGKGISPNLSHPIIKLTLAFVILFIFSSKYHKI